MTKSKKKQSPYLLGAHFSIAGGLHKAFGEAQKYDCNTFQIFTKNANTWKERELTAAEIDQFQQTRSAAGITAIASHTSYLINLATDDRKKQAMSCRALEKELVRSSLLDIPLVVLHPGSHKGSGEKEGIQRIIDNINQILARIPDLKTRLLLETTAGQGFSIGHTFEHLAAIMAGVEHKEALGFCLDSSHIFAAGYDIRTSAAYKRTVKAFDTTVGLKHLYLIHLNDSKKELGSRVDRHEHIGQGHIGLKGFELLMNDPRLQAIPKIIETPKQQNGKDYDRINLTILRNLVEAVLK